MPLDIERVKEEVKNYNDSKELVLCDNLIRRVFSINLIRRILCIKESEREIWMRVIILNALWECNLSNQVENVASRLWGKWREIQNIIKNLQNISLNHENQERVCDSAEKLLKIIFGDGPNILVFASKFCHWIAPKVFPIIDRKNVRPAIYQHQVEENVEENERIVENPNALTMIDHCINDYQKLIRFYAHELQAFSRSDIDDLICYDYDKQPPNYQHTNTILRVLDKYFWKRGQQL